jgi:hypothetical protein
MPDGTLNVWQLARRLRIPASWLHVQIQRGIITVPIDEQAGRFVFPDTPATLTKIQQLRTGRINKLHF